VLATRGRPSLTRATKVRRGGMVVYSIYLEVDNWAGSIKQSEFHQLEFVLNLDLKLVARPAGGGEGHAGWGLRILPNHCR